MFLRLRFALNKRRVIRLTRRVNRLMVRIDFLRIDNRNHVRLLEEFEKKLLREPGLFLRLRIWLLRLSLRAYVRRRYARLLSRCDRINKRVARATDNVRDLSDRLVARRAATTLMGWLKADSMWASRRRWVLK
jgi:hypothetical protein